MVMLLLILLLLQQTKYVQCTPIFSNALKHYSLMHEDTKSHVTTYLKNDVKKYLITNPEDEIIFLTGWKDILLAKSRTEIRQSFEYLVAGSRKCISGCNLYKDKFLNGEYPYLDASVIIGDASKLIESLPDDIDSVGSLQNTLTNLYLSGSSIVTVDVTGETILGIDNSNFKKVAMQFAESNNTLTVGDKKPEILFLSDVASSSATKLFHEIGRYVGDGVTRSSCNFCTQTSESTASSLFIVVHIDKDIPFMLNTLKSVQEIHYDKSKIELVVLCLTGNSEVLTWQPQGFASFHLLTQEFDNEDYDNRFMLLKMFAKTTAEYFVYLDSTVFLTPDAIPELLRYQKPFISPMLTRGDGTAWANFWGSFTDSWSYKRSSDYDNIYTRSVTGLYPVACTRNMYIVQRQLALDMIKWNVFDNHVEPDISFCKTLFEERVPMFLSNVHKYGTLKVPDNETDLELIYKYKDEWKQKYINKSILEVNAFSMPCRNVFVQSGVFTREFGRDLIKALDSVNSWKLHPTWHDRPGFHMNTRKSKYNATLTNVVLDLTVDAVSQLFPGYNPKRQLYDSWIIEVEGKKGQDRSTRHDSVAAYHVVVPLSDMGSDGGFWFGKQDCKVLDLKAGDLMIFPGFITHKKQDWETEDGMTHYLEMSFDIPN